MRTDVTKRDIPGGLILLVGTGFAIAHVVAEKVSNFCAAAAWWCVERAERRS